MKSKSLYCTTIVTSHSSNYMKYQVLAIIDVKAPRRKGTYWHCSIPSFGVARDTRESRHLAAKLMYSGLRISSTIILRKDLQSVALPIVAWLVAVARRIIIL